MAGQEKHRVLEVEHEFGLDRKTARWSTRNMDLVLGRTLGFYQLGMDAVNPVVHLAGRRNLLTVPAAR